VSSVYIVDWSVCNVSVLCDKTAKAITCDFYLKLAKCFNFWRGKFNGEFYSGRLDWLLKLGWDGFQLSLRSYITETVQGGAYRPQFIAKYRDGLFYWH